MFAFFLKFVALVVCFIFASAFLGGAARSIAEEKYYDFGLDFMLAIAYIYGMVLILQ